MVVLAILEVPVALSGYLTLHGIFIDYLIELQGLQAYLIVALTLLAMPLARRVARAPRRLTFMETITVGALVSLITIAGYVAIETLLPQRISATTLPGLARWGLTAADLAGLVLTPVIFPPLQRRFKIGAPLRRRP